MENFPLNPQRGLLTTHQIKDLVPPPLRRFTAKEGQLELAGTSDHPPNQRFGPPSLPDGKEGQEVERLIKRLCGNKRINKQRNDFSERKNRY